MSLFDWLANLFRRRPVPTPPAPSPAPAPGPGADADAMLAAHNAARARAGRGPLGLDARLSAAAQGHADHMAKVGVLAHSGIGDGDPWTRIRAAGIVARASAENVAMGYPDAERVTAAWMADPPHASNVLGDYAVAGFGRSGNYWCADYARA